LFENSDSKENYDSTLQKNSKLSDQFSSSSNEEEDELEAKKTPPTTSVKYSGTDIEVNRHLK
jgi:hypothetical protein